ncbi:MAG TPA: formimidoylglutamase [Cyclobacteriaceae bacterium]|nr:formimidoylglutamase [Cyclobacteriaceae bacterium]
MEINIFFTPVSESLYRDIGTSSSFFNNIYLPGKAFPDFSQADIAIIGLTENRGSRNNPGVSGAADEIRKKLYRLKKGTGKYKIIDLGNLRNGNSLDDTLGRLTEACNMLMDKEVMPLVIGGSHDLDLGMFTAYRDLGKLVSVLNIDAMLDMDNGDPADESHSHVRKLLMLEPNFLFNFSQIGYQTYLIDPESISIMEQLYFETYRVGKLRHNIYEMEPVIRDADMLSFDITGIKSGDAPGNANAQPFGLTGEEACQICWYAGLNEKLSSAGFFEYNPDLDDTLRKTASVVATMVWYFIEGFYNRKDHFSFKSNHYLKYLVSMPGDPESIVFYKSKISEKWWLEVPNISTRKVFERKSIVPCSYADYQKAMKGEVPERWVNAQARMT